MSSPATPPTAQNTPLGGDPPPVRIVTERHRLGVRLGHWVNVVALFALLFSGLQIFNAHPALYWGPRSDFERPVLAMAAEDAGGGRLRGTTTLAGRRFDTTGVLGLSVERGEAVERGFPAWATLPSYRDLATGRRWHFFFAWLFAVNGAVYLAAAVLGGHLRRDLAPTRRDLRHIGADVWDHLRLRFPKGWAAARYNVLQKLAYLGVILVLGPTMLLTGMTMSPGLDAAMPWLLDLFGGRQSARTLHFAAASLIVLFIAVHLVMVLLSGPINQLRGMITGRYVVVVPKEAARPGKEAKEEA